MRKSCTKLLIFLATIILATSFGFAQTGIKINIDGEELNLKQASITLNEVKMIPARDVFEALGFKIEWDAKSQRIVAKKDMTNISFAIGDKVAYKNGLSISLDMAPYMVSGTTMIPINLVGNSLDINMSWDSKEQTIYIETKAYSIAKEDRKTLSYEDAEKTALDKNIQIKNLTLDIKKAELNKEQATDKVFFTPLDKGNSAANATYIAYENSKISLESAKKQLELEKEKLAYSVKKAYNAVITAERQNELAELSLEYATRQYRMAETKYKNSQISEYELKQQENSLKATTDRVKSAETAVTSAYENLNQLMNVSVSERYVLTNSPARVLENVRKEDLQLHINRVLSASTAVWLAEQNVQLSNFDVDYYTFNSGTVGGREIKKIDVTKANNNLTSTKKQLEEALRGIDTNLENLERNYNTLLNELNGLQDTLKMTTIRRDAGLATEMDVLGAKLNVAQKEQELFNTAVQYEEISIAYEKPWVGAGN